MWNQTQRKQILYNRHVVEVQFDIMQLSQRISPSVGILQLNKLLQKVDFTNFHLC